MGSTTGPGLGLALVLGLTVGCYSGVQNLDGDGGSEGSGSAGDTAGTGDGPDGLGPEAELPAPTTRFFRLTHVQWENSVQDLLYLDAPTGLSEDLRADPFVGGFIFDNNALSLEVDEALWAGYQRAAVDLAEMVATDPARLDAIAPPDPDEAARAETFVRTFGRRAFRRPLTEAEVTTFLDLHGQGTTLYEDTTGFASGVRLVLEGMLQSPHFIYRIESSAEIVDEVIPLSSFEIASRLSYLLWNSMPDDALLDAAEADALTDPAEIEAQVLRMLDDPRAEEAVRRFHHQLLQVDKFMAASPSAAFYPDAPADLGALATTEHQEFLRHTIFEQDGSWRDLLTSSETFVNDELAALYGLAGTFGADFQRVDLDPTQRAGLFTQIGFLVANATSVDPDPIHRGAYLARHIACHTIAAPPDNVPPVPAPQPDQTNRENIVAHTEAPGSDCISCHKPLINPFGFAYEHYDSTGAFRTEDNGKAVDAATTVLLASGTVDVTDAVELATAMADDLQVHECYLEHWMEFAMGRPYDDLDAPLVERLATSSFEDAAVKQVLVELATSRPFLTRSVDEL